MVKVLKHKRHVGYEKPLNKQSGKLRFVAIIKKQQKREDKQLQQDLLECLRR